MSRLTKLQIKEKLKKLPGWTFASDAISRQFTFADFPDAVAFVARLVPGAEKADHHPDLEINYRRVTVTYTTHSEGGVTSKDFAGARMADKCV